MTMTRRLGPGMCGAHVSKMKMDITYRVIPRMFPLFLNILDTGKHRRVLWGWANESDSAAAVRKGWAGVQAIPRKIWLAPDDRTASAAPAVAGGGARLPPR
jgi:hypothetical protein